MAKELDMLNKSLQENLDLTAYSQVGHTHNYAGSSTAGGAATSATKLATARKINGTSFNGTGDITTANWGTARTITIGDSGKSVNGSGNISWTLTEIGAVSKADFDNLTIGGRNYVLDSKKETTTTSTYQTRNLSSDAAADLAGKVVTFSFDLKGTTAGGNIYVYFRSSSGSITPVSQTIGAATTEYKRYSITFTAPADLSTAVTAAVHTTSAIGTASLKNFKVELGHKATSWCYAIEDYTLDSELTTALAGKANTSHGTHVTYATATPKANGTAAVGTSSKVAREDHVHPLQTSAATWTTARTLTIGNTGKSVDGSANVTWTLAEIGAAASSHTHNYAGSSSAGGAANSVKTNLVIKLNSGSTEGTNLFTFNGSTAKTINITPNAIGAAASSHGTHVTYSTSVPLVAGTAAVGSANNVARGDHVHPAQTSVTGNAGTATKLATARTIQIGNKSNTFDGSANITYTLADIGAAPISHGQHAVYGTCSTAAGTAEKAITVSGSGFSLAAGQMISVKFTTSNTASSVKFNVNSTGAKPIWYNNAEYTGTSNRVTGYANAVMTYVYNGSHWVWVSSGVDNNTTYSNVSLGHGYATCDTAEATVAKVGTLSSYSLQKGGIVAVKFSYNVPASATLNINSKGAKAIYFRNAAITANIIKAGDTATFMYDGSYYQLLSIDRWQNDITSHTHNYAGSSSAGGAANTAVKWHTARTLTIGNTGKSVDGSGNQSWSIAEIGAIPLTGNTGAYSITGNLEFASPSNNTFRGVVGKAGVNDYWRVGGQATADNAGYMEIATADDADEPIYVRQYSGAYSTLSRTLTLLDASGNTSMPGNLSVTKSVSAQDITASGNVTVTGTVKVGSVTMKYNDTSESLDFIFG